jgi:ADP-ribose pyrophosphatase YjhB (NUDIX family)
MPAIIQQVTTGEMSPTQDDCVFLWLYCLDGKPYAKYLPAGAPLEMPMVLVMLRWDCGFGTMGGKVDPGEALRRALAREACEEADFWVPTNAELESLGTFQDGDWRVHSFAMQVSYAELVEARAKASRVSETSPECTGWNIVPTQDYLPDDDVPRGVTAFRMNNFRSTAKLEFDVLLELIRSKQ